jgi:hypothetical protein
MGEDDDNTNCERRSASMRRAVKNCRRTVMNGKKCEGMPNVAKEILSLGGISRSNFRLLTVGM